MCYIANCNICGGTLQGQTFCVLQCGHTFRESWYQSWRGSGSASGGAVNLCPVCRNELSLPQQVGTITPLLSQENIESNNNNNQIRCHFCRIRGGDDDDLNLCVMCNEMCYSNCGCGVEDPDNYEFLCDSCQTIYSTKHNNSNENNHTPIGD